MINGERVLAIIPARGGSKRTPRKNLKSYHGKPLIAWSFDTVRNSKYVDTYLLSSEDIEILDIAKRYKFPTLLRPAFLATDDAMNEAVLVHCLYELGPEKYQWVVLLQPTSPERTTEDIDTCIERAQLGNGCITYNESGARNGAVYVVRVSKLLATLQLSEDQFYIMPNSRSLDIDYPQDFQ